MSNLPTGRPPLPPPSSNPHRLLSGQQSAHDWSPYFQPCPSLIQCPQSSPNNLSENQSDHITLLLKILHWLSSSPRKFKRLVARHTPTLACVSQLIHATFPLAREAPRAQLFFSSVHTSCSSQIQGLGFAICCLVCSSHSSSGC